MKISTVLALVLVARCAFAEVELYRFDAYDGHGDITLQWETVAEIDNAGFELLREGQLVHTAVSRGSQGGFYGWTDRNVPPDSLFHYTLVAVGTDDIRETLGTVSAQASPFIPMSAWFTDCMESVGCPCDYPLQPPIGTPVCLFHDLDSNTVSDMDTVIACFEFGAGAGLPPWDCEWVPSPDLRLSPGYYYLKITTDACCWVAGSYMSSNGGGTMAVTPEAWECYDVPCEQAQPPAPPSFISVDCDGNPVTIEWTHDGQNVLGYNLYRNGDLLANFYWQGAHSYQDMTVVPGVPYAYCVSAFNHFGESAWTCAPPCIVQPEPPAPSMIARPTPATIPSCLIAPNPFNAETAIALTLPTDAFVTLAVYDVQGRRVATLADRPLPSGTHRFTFNGTHLPSGLYFARLSTGNQQRVAKMMLLK